MAVPLNSSDQKSVQSESFVEFVAASGLIVGVLASPKL
ncbi:hypothetical protein SAMD00020551_4478 [Mesobacillus selenatarsenatis SF-1]|uniref:Uncharacterized protein n=1 Tax=Mesobacillus selenatarsenatis (strain DSM 18680 / JCM 14380 / FERM P-15431 / SF-1) TaxID=1321606 RepID=A0A0A8X8K7_MESS1|nr:hypothetical protein SAMD00020551_4478 [Mesobacillus selenatarsenatis SF-1]